MVQRWSGQQEVCPVCQPSWPPRDAGWLEDTVVSEDLPGFLLKMPLLVVADGS